MLHDVHLTGWTAARRDSVRVFKQFAWLEVGSDKIALSVPAPPDRACRDHQRVTPAVGQADLFLEK